jgi:hypothetical protein
MQDRIVTRWLLANCARGAALSPFCEAGPAAVSSENILRAAIAMQDENTSTMCRAPVARVAAY